MVDLHGLASYIKIRNVVDEEISRTIGRPAHAGHIAEYVAATIFDIKLMTNASYKAIDGHFRSGPLTDQSVNVKFGTRKDGMLNLVSSYDASKHPHYYLVLTGPSVGAVSSKGLSAPWVIRQVLLFRSDELLASLAERRIKLGVATSVRAALWDAAMIYPIQVNQSLMLSDDQREALKLFWGVETLASATAQ